MLTKDNIVLVQQKIDRAVHCSVVHRRAVLDVAGSASYHYSSSPLWCGTADAAHGQFR